MTLPATIKSYLEAIEGDEKFILVLGAGVVDTALLVCGCIDQSTYLNLTTITVGSYIAGKCVESFSANKSA